MVQTRQDKKVPAGEESKFLTQGNRKDDPEKQVDMKSPPAEMKDAPTSEKKQPAKKQPAKQDPKKIDGEPVPDDKEKPKQADQSSGPNSGKDEDSEDASTKTDDSGKNSAESEGYPEADDDGEPTGDPECDDTPVITCRLQQKPSPLRWVHEDFNEAFNLCTDFGGLNQSNDNHFK